MLTRGEVLDSVIRECYWGTEGPEFASVATERSNRSSALNSAGIGWSFPAYVIVASGLLTLKICIRTSVLRERLLAPDSEFAQERAPSSTFTPS